MERERGGRMLADRPQQGDELLVKWLLFSSRASWILLFLGFGFKVRRFRQFLQIRRSRTLSQGAWQQEDLEPGLCRAKIMKARWWGELGYRPAQAIVIQTSCQEVRCFTTTATPSECVNVLFLITTIFMPIAKKLSSK